MIVTQPREEIAAFVASQCKLPNHWGEYSALAEVDGKGIKVGVIYNHFYPHDDHYHDCMMSVAARVGSKWANHEFLYHAFTYPFIQLGCHRVSAAINRKNKVSQRLCLRLGFTFEGEKKDGAPDDDVLYYRLFKSDCEWIKYEQTRRTEAA